MTFAMVVTRRPLSLGAGGKHLFQQALRNQATAIMSGRDMLTGDLYSRILWFHRKPAAQDVDNILKNVHDSLKGVVYRDDSAIVQCLAQRIDLARPYRLFDRLGRPDILEELSRLLNDPNEPQILYIEIGSVSEQKAVLGALEGDTQ